MSKKNNIKTLKYIVCTLILLLAAFSNTTYTQDTTYSPIADPARASRGKTIKPDGK